MTPKTISSVPHHILKETASPRKIMLKNVMINADEHAIGYA